MYLTKNEVLEIMAIYDSEGHISKNLVASRVGEDVATRRPIKKLIEYLTDEGDGRDSPYGYDELVYFYKEYNDSVLVHYLCDDSFDHIVTWSIYNSISEHVDYYKEFVLLPERIAHVMSLDNCQVRHHESVEIKFTDSTHGHPEVTILNDKADKLFKKLEMNRFTSPLNNSFTDKVIGESLIASMTFDENSGYFSIVANIKKQITQEEVDGIGKGVGKKILESVFINGVKEMITIIPGTGTAHGVYEDFIEAHEGEKALEDLIKIFSGSKDTHSAMCKIHDYLEENPESEKSMLNGLDVELHKDRCYQICVERSRELSDDKRLEIEYGKDDIILDGHTDDEKIAYIQSYRLNSGKY